MATTRDEAIVQLGLDGKPVADGLRNVETQIQSFASKFNKFFELGLGAGVAVTAINMIKQAAESLVIYFTTEYTKMWYGDSEALARWSSKLEDSTKKLRDLRVELGKSAEAFSSALGSSIFKRATDPDKENMTFSALEVARKRTEQARKDLDAIKSQSGLITGNRTEFLTAQANAEIELNKALTDEVNLSDQLDEVQLRIAKNREDEAKRAEEEARKEEERWQDKLKRSKEWQQRQDASLMSDMQRRRAASQSDLASFMPSISELARSGVAWGSPTSTTGFGFRQGPFAATAQYIEQLGERAKNQFIFGNVEGAKASISERNKRYDALAAMGIVPERSEKAAEAQIKTADIIERIGNGSLTLSAALKLVED